MDVNGVGNPHPISPPRLNEFIAIPGFFSLILQQLLKKNIFKNDNCKNIDKFILLYTILEGISLHFLQFLYQ